MWMLASLVVVLLLFVAYRFRSRENGKEEGVQRQQPKETVHRLRTLEGWLGKHVLPTSYKGWLEKKLFASGNPKVTTADRLFFRQCVMGLSGFILTAILPQRGGLLFALFLASACFLFPVFQLQSPAKQREKEVRQVVRNWLMLLIPLLEGNLHFQSTLFDVFRRTPGDLKEEIDRIMLQVAGGRALRDTLGDAASRVQVREFVQLVRVLGDGDRYGPQEMAAKLKELKARMDRHDRRRAKKQIKDAVMRLFFVVLLFIFVPIMILGFLILIQSLKQNVPL